MKKTITHAQGFSLLELMVASAVGLVLRGTDIAMFWCGGGDTDFCDVCSLGTMPTCCSAAAGTAGAL